MLLPCSPSLKKGTLWCFSSVFRKTGDLIWTTDCASVLGVQTHKHIRKSVPLSQQFLSSVNMDRLPLCGGLPLNILEHLVAHSLGNIGLTRSRVCKVQPAGHIGLATYLCKVLLAYSHSCWFTDVCWDRQGQSCAFAGDPYGSQCLKYLPSGYLQKKFANFYTNLEVIHEHGLKKSDGRETLITKNKSLIFQRQCNFDGSC